MNIDFIRFFVKKWEFNKGGFERNLSDSAKHDIDIDYKIALTNPPSKKAGLLITLISKITFVPIKKTFLVYETEHYFVVDYATSDGNTAWIDTELSSCYQRHLKEYNIRSLPHFQFSIQSQVDHWAAVAPIISQLEAATQ